MIFFNHQISTISTYSDSFTTTGVGTLSGTPQVQSFSIPKLFLCIVILKNPDSPQYVPQLFLPTQYYTPFSFPQPTTAISWLIIGKSFA